VTSPYRIGWIRKTFINCSNITRTSQHGSTITADDTACELALSQRKTQRASDQTRSNDCDLADWHEWR